MNSLKLTTAEFLKRIAPTGPGPWACFGGHGSRWHIVLPKLEPVLVSDIKDRLWQGRPQALPFQRGYVGLIEYNDLAGGEFKNSRVYRAEGALVWDSRTFELHRTGTNSPALDEALDALIEPIDRPVEPIDPVALIGDRTEKDYLDACAKALNDIRNGRFYQINLLRYFTIAHPKPGAALAARYRRLAGPFGAWFYEDEREVISFSPERFVRIAPTRSGQFKIATFPIKGTVANSPEEGTQLAEALVASAKDRAELHMIVDLMRNDLLRVAVAGSVDVVDPGSLHQFATVQHLIAHIEGVLRPSVSWIELMRKLGPGGSITGAPKAEVVRAIQSYESTSRGLFMGHAFFWDDQSGYFDSSILIRTAVRKGQSWRYAAGSGIVIKSDPIQELAEIATKCRVITDLT